MSIGHPSTVPAFALQNRSVSNRNRLVKAPPRTADSFNSNSIDPVNIGQPESFPTPVQATNARRILELMRSSCGRMEGRLAFRRGNVDQWTLAYCSVNEEAGSLVYEIYSNKNDMNPKTLIPDLRSCQIRTGFDGEGRMPYLDVCPHCSNLEVHLRPHTQDEFDSWFAALLCWQPIRPKGLQNRMTKPQSPVISERRLADSRRHSEVSLLKEAPIIKVGKMTFWDTSVSHSNTSGTPRGVRPQVQRMESFASKRWRRVSCTLRENGELKLYSESDVTLVSVVQLSHLSRCAVQRLDPSVLDEEFCIAIFPQYSMTSTHISLVRPIVLSLDTRVQYEVWVVLLRAFTIPQLYGPKQQSIQDERSSPQPSQGLFSPTTADMFRMERSLNVRIMEARIIDHSSSKAPESSHNGKSPDPGSPSIAHYAEMQLDGETRARTMAKDGNNPFWREEFDFHDLPDVTSIATILVKKKIPQHLQKEKNNKDETRRIFDVLSSSANHTSNGGYSDVNFDATVGKVDIVLDDVDPAKEGEKWWPLVNSYGARVGEALLRLEADECVILMARDYQPLSELLHRFSSGLTLQIAHMVPGDLRRLSDCLLNIFQVSGTAGDWIMALVEEEVDGTVKETPVSRLRFARRMGSNESSENFGSTSEREQLVRDLGKNATLEANLLFRGNTLLTKSLDTHMKRLGKEYLDEILGEKLTEIAGQNPDCEVDPNRVASGASLDRNWKRLIKYTEEIWFCIFHSVTRCPPELRLIFRHIRACAEDRYGDFLRSVKYSSVSGFLFLRFFVPAVLNPKLFGLLKDHPQTQARRTLTLIAKSLQGLANMSTFGSKEHWMEPMNVFLTSHRQEFKTLIDNICSIPSSASPLPTLTPSYSTPIQILQRLPPTSREGFPSLPYLIDHARNFANLVALWLDRSTPMANNIRPSDGDLLKFHRLCVAIAARTTDCLARAERADRPSSALSVRWEDLIDQLGHVAGIEAQQGA
ncbi:Rho GTPase activation protein, partial [Eremomyces bilateralis CBS 781.70]